MSSENKNSSHRESDSPVLLRNPNNGDDVLSTSSYESDFSLSKIEEPIGDTTEDKDKNKNKNKHKNKGKVKHKKEDKNKEQANHKEQDKKIDEDTGNLADTQVNNDVENSQSTVQVSSDTSKNDESTLETNIESSLGSKVDSNTSSIPISENDPVEKMEGEKMEERDQKIIDSIKESISEIVRREIAVLMKPLQPISLSDEESTDYSEDETLPPFSVFKNEKNTALAIRINTPENINSRLVLRKSGKLVTKDKVDSNHEKKDNGDSTTECVLAAFLALGLAGLIGCIVFIGLSMGGSSSDKLKRKIDVRLISQLPANISNIDYSNLTFRVDKVSSDRHIKLAGKYIIDFTENKMVRFLDDNLLTKAWSVVKGNNDKLNNWLLVNYNNFLQHMNQTGVTSFGDMACANVTSCQ